MFCFHFISVLFGKLYNLLRGLTVWSEVTGALNNASELNSWD